MTLPYERKNSMNQTREFLYVLLDPQKTPRVPKEIRKRASALLRHYPTQFDVNELFKLESDDSEVAALLKQPMMYK
jgi:hypothetical protein